MWKCVNCGKENQRDRTQCWKCGTKKDGTPPDNPENFLLASERGSTIDRATEPRIEGERKNSPLPLESQTPKRVTESAEVRVLMSRYWDAYVTARVTVGLGEVIKVVAIVSAVLIALCAMLLAGQVGGGGAAVTFFLGIIGAAFAGGQFYLLGVIVTAQGQILKASLDGAVNGSPFLENEHRAKIMSLK